ncbi:MAG: ATP-binding protein [Deltaproteobacteria bacterium]|nr:ATP-binding protein [Deltaproteobacteria bacterium]
MTWPHLPYVNLERPDQRRFAQSDPVALLRSYPDGVILDEVQRVPELSSWIQAEIDEDRRPGRFVLTGSEQLRLTQHTSQSLAGRAAYAHLLPLDLAERAHLMEPGVGFASAVLRGGYPALYSQPVERDVWLSAYTQSYLERDVRSLRAVGDLGRFQDFLALAAGRTAQTLNLSRFASDVGASGPTIKSWLSVLEASFVALRLRSWQKNLGKRVIRAPRLHFWDSGLLCHLLGIRDAEQLFTHPLRGSIFETFVVSELLKMAQHRGERPEAYFYRDQGGLQVDLLLRRPSHYLALEVKSAATVSDSFFRGLARFGQLAARGLDHLPVRQVVVYGGDERQRRSGVEVVPWRELPSLLDE